MTFDIFRHILVAYIYRMLPILDIGYFQIFLDSWIFLYMEKRIKS